jgi:hypothetical protein
MALLVVGARDVGTAQTIHPTTDMPAVRSRSTRRRAGRGGVPRRLRASGRARLLLDRRVRAAALAEPVNHAIGAHIAGHHEFAARARRRLDEVLAADS